jgi:protein-S-isoprenylcysteine O-methyltransferase Ste14
MYDNLTFPVASSLLGAIAAVMACVVWLLIIFGPRLRARSKIAVSLLQQEGEVLSDDDNHSMSRVEA